MMLLTLGTAVPIAMREWITGRNATRFKTADGIGRIVSPFQRQLYGVVRALSGKERAGSIMPSGGASKGVKKVVLAYSGGLDTSVAISWIGKETGREVVAVAIDLGQGGEDMEVVRQRALDCGAVEAVVVDARDEFADEYCLPTVQSNALYMDRYPLVSAISRPLIVKHLVAAAREHGGGIEPAPVAPVFEVQVRTGGPAAGARGAQQVAGRHALAGTRHRKGQPA